MIVWHPPLSLIVVRARKEIQNWKINPSHLRTLHPPHPAPFRSFVFKISHFIGIWCFLFGASPRLLTSSTPYSSSVIRIWFLDFFGICDLEFSASSRVLLLDSSTPPLLFGHSYLGFRICLAAGRRVWDLTFVIWCFLLGISLQLLHSLLLFGHLNLGFRIYL